MVLGGTGAMGGATALRLARAGWRVDVTGRDAALVPADLTAMGVRFHAVDRADVGSVDRLVGDDADLLVDLVAYGSDDVAQLLPAMRRVRSSVLVSSRAVYTDAQGRHINGDEAPVFDVPIPEDAPTVPAAGPGVDPFSREGYAPAKVAAERAALDSGLPVTVLRPSKVHGPWARNARTRAFVERMRAGDRVIPLARRGASVDHLTAAANAAALVEVVADAPGARVLNVADPDTPAAVEIVRAIADELAWDGELELLAPGVDGGAHPWNSTHPIVLDTAAAARLGYRPVGPALDLLRDEVRWVAAGPSAR